MCSICILNSGCVANAAVIIWHLIACELRSYVVYAYAMQQWYMNRRAVKGLYPVYDVSVLYARDSLIQQLLCVCSLTNAVATRDRQYSLSIIPAASLACGDVFLFKRLIDETIACWVNDKLI